MRALQILVFTAVVLTLAASSAPAHHSFAAEFDGNAPVLLKGKFFEAKFKPTLGAKEAPKPPAPQLDDKTPEYKGQGQFLTNNKKYKGT